jgi:uncharacterized membrane protein
MSGKEQIKEGLARSAVGVKPDFETRLDAAERRISEALVAGGEGRDYALDALDRIEEIKEDDAYRDAMQDSAANAARNFATFFALASVGILLTLKAVGLVEVSLLGAFIPALAVIVSLAFVRFMASRGYTWLTALLDVFFCFAVVVLILALIPLALILCAVAYAVKPLKAPIMKLVTWATTRVRSSADRTSDKLATT